MSSPQIGQPLDLSNPKNTEKSNVNRKNNHDNLKKIYVPGRNNEMRKMGNLCDASSHEFREELYNILKQQTSIRPILIKLNDIFQEIADKYQLGTANSSNKGNDSIISSPDPRSLSQTPSGAQAVVPPQLTRKAEEMDVDETHAYNPPKKARMEYDLNSPEVVLVSGKPMIKIGPNSTLVCAHEYESIQWISAAVATRSLLNMIFTDEDLATHTLSGKPSPAFHGRERPTKMQLDPLKVADIIYCIKFKTNGKDRDVRATITTKCADSAKLFKKRLDRKLTI